MGKKANLHQLVLRDGRFNVEAFTFVGASLKHAAKLFGKEQADGAERHLSAQQLVEGALDLAVERYGLLAELVLRSWGVRDSEDVGAITFALIDHGIFSKHPGDRIEDFYAGPEFGP